MLHALTRWSVHSPGGGGRAQGEHETALEFFLQSLVVYELELGEEDLKTAAMCNKLATVMTSMTEHDHALEYASSPRRWWLCAHVLG